MPDALDEQLDAYQGLLPELKKNHGSVWALVAHRELIGTFQDFGAAARYAVQHLSHEQVLIRHTDERLETVPFIQLDG